MKTEHKAQIGTLQGIVLSLVIIGVLIGAAFLILAEFKDGTSQVSISITGETGAFFNSSGYTVDEVNREGFGNFAVVTAINSTSGLLIASGNYSANATTGVVINATAIVWQAVTLNYTASEDSEAQKGVSDTITALKKVPALLGLVVLIAVISVIVALVFGAFPGARGGNQT